MADQSIPAERSPGRETSQVRGTVPIRCRSLATLFVPHFVPLCLGPLGPERTLMTHPERQCESCARSLPLSQFKNRHGRAVNYPHCRSCRKAYRASQR